MDIKQSKTAFAEALKYIPGGVDSPVRAFKSVGRPPRFMAAGKGARIYDVDGNEYIDFCMAWGSLILGHAHTDVVTEVKNAVDRGTSFGCPTLLETELAKLIVKAVPSIERVRFVNSGTEAVMSAVRLARAFTRRDKIVKFDGCYHGHADHLLVKAGSGAGYLPQSSSSGVPAGFAAETISIPFNDAKALEKVMNEFRDEIACVIIEPVPANMGLVLPRETFLEDVRRITTKNEALLVFDEVITGFRLSRGGAQEYFGIRPDLTCLGKIIGGGFPVGAFGGRVDIMNMLAPDGDVYQAGTLSGNPVAMAAGIATLQHLMTDGFYSDLRAKTTFMEKELSRVKMDDVKFVSMESMFCFFAGCARKPENYRDVTDCDADVFSSFYNRLLDSGVYLSPSQFETNFISAAHTENELCGVVKAVTSAL